MIYEQPVKALPLILKACLIPFPGNPPWGKIEIRENYMLRM